MTLVSAGQTGASARPGMSPDGSGETYGDCGYSYLYTNASTDVVEIYLVSTLGSFTGGYWTATTDGLLTSVASGSIPNMNGLWSWDHATSLNPGWDPMWAYAYGLVNVTGGTCYFYVTADWS